MWDDSALIQEYDRAWKSWVRGGGLVLIVFMKGACQEEARGKGRSWQIGDACRAVYSVEGEEFGRYLSAKQSCV